MTDLLDDKIRRLVNEVVEGAPTTVHPPPTELGHGLSTGSGRRLMLLGTAAVLVFGIIGAVLLASDDTTDEPIELAETETTEPGEVDEPGNEQWPFRLPEIFERPRTPADGLPDLLRGSFARVDADTSRRTVKADGFVLWVAHSADRSEVCWSALAEGSSGHSLGCANAGEDTPFGIAATTSLSTSGADRWFITSGVIFRDDVVGIVGGTLERDVFMHPSESAPTFLLRDGSTVTPPGPPAPATLEEPEYTDEYSQRTEGNGWRLLFDQPVGAGRSTWVASTQDQYEELMSRLDESGQTPAEVDFETEVVIWFSTIHSGSCPTVLDDVVFNSDAAIVHSATVRSDGSPTGEPLQCTRDARTRSYVVAVDRNLLPEAPFTVQLEAFATGEDHRSTEVTARMLSGEAPPPSLETRLPDRSNTQPPTTEPQSDEAPRDVEDIATAIIGMNEQTAIDTITANGFSARIVERAGERIAHTLDVRFNRINLAIADGIVIHAYVG